MFLMTPVSLSQPLRVLITMMKWAVANRSSLSERAEGSGRSGNVFCPVPSPVCGSSSYPMLAKLHGLWWDCAVLVQS